MDEFDPLERRLRSASDDVRQLTPDATGRFESVRSLVRRRAVARRAIASLSALALVAGGVALAAATDDDETRLAAGSGVTTSTVKKPTTTVVEKTSDTTQPPKTTSTTAEPKQPVAIPEKTTTSTTAKEPTTIPPKTTTTTGVKRAGPPTGYVASRLGEVQAVEGSSCWKGAEGESALCADVGPGWADDAPVIEISTSDYVKARWDTKEQPKAVEAYAFVRRDGQTDYGARQDFTCMGGNPCKIALTLEPGEYVLMVTSFWAQGDVSHGVRLLVR